MARGLAISVLATVLLVGDAACARQTEPVALEECVRLALTEHPALAGADADVEAADQRVRQSVSGFLPRVGAEYSFARQSRTLGSLIRGPSATDIGSRTQLFNFHSGGFSFLQLLFDFGKTLDLTRASSALADSAQADREAVVQRVTLNVKRAYYELIASRRLLIVAEETEAQTRRHLDEARQRYQVGVAPRFDVTQQEVQLANAELARLVAGNQVNLGRENLRNAMGLTEPVTFDPSDQALDYVPLEIEEPTTVSRAYEHRPELRSLQGRIRAQQGQVTALKKDYLPVAEGVGNYGFTGDDGPDEEGWLIGANVRLSIFNGGLTTAQIGESRAQLLRLRAEEEELRQRVALEVRQSILNLAAAAEGVRVSAKAVEQARESLAIAEGRYSAGVGNIIELTDAQVALAGARANHVRVLTVYWIAVAELEHAIGEPLDPTIS